MVDAVRPVLLSLCDWLPPDFGAVGQYAAIEARRVAAEGAEVTLVGFSSTAASVVEERVGEGLLRTVRIRMPAYDRSSFARRLVWTVRANRALLEAAAPFVGAAEEILFTGSPPLFLHWIVPANRRWGKRLVYRITDFHPECLIAERGGASLAVEMLRRRTLRLRRRVDRFEVLGEDQRRRLLEIGIAAERIVLRRDESPVEVGAATEPLALPAELAGKIVLLYSGNFGVAHDDATFVDGYERHHRDRAGRSGGGRVVLWLNATGAKADRVEAELRRRDLPVYRSQPVPIEELARLLVTPHAHLITLRDEFVGYVLPSKVYGAIASGKPVLFVGSAESDVDLLCRERIPESYTRVAVGDVEGVAEALARLGAKPWVGARANASRSLPEDGVR